MQPCHGMYIYYVMGMQPFMTRVKLYVKPCHDPCQALCQAGYDAALS